MLLIGGNALRVEGGRRCWARQGQIIRYIISSCWQLCGSQACLDVALLPPSVASSYSTYGQKDTDTFSVSPELIKVLYTQQGLHQCSLD